MERERERGGGNQVKKGGWAKMGRDADTDSF